MAHSSSATLQGHAFRSRENALMLTGIAGEHRSRNTSTSLSPILPAAAALRAPTPARACLQRWSPRSNQATTSSLSSVTTTGSTSLSPFRIESPLTQNSGSPATSDRASVGGTGSETTTVTLADGTVEVVQTFVTYEKNMVRDVLAKGGIPIVSSQTPNGDAWDSTKTKISTPVRFVGYAEVAAQQTGAAYIDHWKVSLRC